MGRRAVSLRSLWLVPLLSAVALRFAAAAGGLGREESSSAAAQGWPPRHLDTGGLSRGSFPEGFVFGTAASAYQVEGMAHKDGRGPSIWDVFVKIPGTIAKNATADVTVDEYHKYKEDIDIMKRMNFDAYRFSISWTRIFPKGEGKVNWLGVAYYNRLIDYMIKKGITPYANLYHYDLPEVLEEKYNGLLSKKVVAGFCYRLRLRLPLGLPAHQPPARFPPARRCRHRSCSAARPLARCHRHRVHHHCRRLRHRPLSSPALLPPPVAAAARRRRRWEPGPCPFPYRVLVNNSRSEKAFADYADFCFKTFGDRVKNWFTFNEPRVVAALGYDNGFFAPGRCSKEFGNCTAGNSSTEPYIAAHNLILSHAAAVQRYREKYQATQKGKIGILLDFVWYEPLTNSSDDEAAAQRSRDFHIGWFLHPIVYGEYPKNMQEIVGERLPKFSPEELKMVKGSIDYVGINQYTAYYMYDPHKPKPKVPGYQVDWNAGFAYERNGVPIGPRAYSYWLYIVPWGMYKAVTYVKEHYGNPTVILSENGMDDPGNVTLPAGLHDTTRVNYYKSYLIELKKAIDDGANVIGYFAWSLLDNFEWRSGYTSRFGLVYVDYTNLKRYPKMSAWWFREMIRQKKH